MYGSDLSLQRRFPIDDILFQSRDISDYVAKLSQISPKFWRFWAAKFFWGGTPQISDSISKITVTTEHVSKFGDDRPRDLRD